MQVNCDNVLGLSAPGVLDALKTRLSSFQLASTDPE